MPDMSDPLAAMQLTVDECRFQAAEARREAEEAMVRANTWDDAERTAARHLARYKQCTPDPDQPDTEENLD